MKTADIKKQIILNWISSITSGKSFNLDDYVKQSKDEIKEYLEEVEINRIKFGDR